MINKSRKIADEVLAQKEHHDSVAKLPFVEPKLTRHDSLVKTTLFAGAAAPGAAAIAS